MTNAFLSHTEVTASTLLTPKVCFSSDANDETVEGSAFGGY